MRNDSVVQATKEMMRDDSAVRAVIQGWGVVTLLIGIFMFYMGANTYIQSYKQTDWVFGSAYITDISELNRSGVGRGRISYSMTYEYFVDGTRYTGEYGPLANSIEVGKSIRIKYDPNAPENSTGILAPGGNDLALVIIGTVLAVPGFFMSGILGVLRRFLRKLLGRDIPDGAEAPPKEKHRASPKAPAPSARDIVMGIRRTLQPFFPILIFLLLGFIVMFIQNARR